MFLEVEAMVSWALTGETLRVDDGDQILDAKKLAKCEVLYDPQGSPQKRPMVVTSKPANGTWPGTRLFYSVAS
jgi:hypothetical protein